MGHSKLIPDNAEDCHAVDRVTNGNDTEDMQREAFTNKAFGLLLRITFNKNVVMDAIIAGSGMVKSTCCLWSLSGSIENTIIIITINISTSVCVTMC